MTYSGGTLSAVEAAPFANVWRAIVVALDAENITLLDRERIEGGGKIDGRTLDLQRVKVTVQTLTEQKTALSIRVDSFGNSELTHSIYKKFKIALGPTP